MHILQLSVKQIYISINFNKLLLTKDYVG